MENKRAKTAIELAMEKVAGMPALEKGTVQQYKDKEQIAIGEGIIQRFLAGTLRKKNLESELSAFQGERAQIIRDAALATLREAIDIENMEQNKIIFDAVPIVWKDLPVKDAQSELIRTVAKYKKQREKEIGSALKKEAARFQSLGITGSAVVPNLHESPEWLEWLQSLKVEFNTKLDSVRKYLKP